MDRIERIVCIFAIIVLYCIVTLQSFTINDLQNRVSNLEAYVTQLDVAQK